MTKLLSKKLSSSIIWILLVLFVNTNAIAQQSPFENRLICKGDIPDDFRKAYSEKYNETLEDKEVQDLKKKKNSREFAALTNYSIDRMLKSGRVLYGDDISSYCNKIVDKLLINQKELSVPIRVYTLKSNDVNAYSTHQGIIIITTGLVARLQNESQLAFVLAHEIAHVTNNHNVESYSYNTELFKNDLGSRKNDLEEKILQSSKHSKKSEFEADNDGWEMYIEAGYSPTKAVGTFDVLLYSYLPAQQKEFPYSDFTGNGFEFKDKVYDFEVVPVLPPEDVDDSNRSHPKVKNRKENIEKKIAELSNTDNDFNLLSQSEFNAVRTKAYNTCVYQHLLANNYVEALVLIDACPDSLKDGSTFLTNAKAMSYFGLQTLSNNFQASSFKSIDDEMQGVQMSYYYVFKKLKRDELNVLAIRELWRLHNLDTTNEIVSRLAKQSLASMQLETEFDWSYFQTEETDSSTFKKLNRKCYSCHDALNGLPNYSGLQSKYENLWAETEIAIEKSKDDDYIEPYTQETTESLVLLSPRYFGIDNRKTIDKRFMQTEKQQEYLEDEIKSSAEKLNIRVKTIDSWKNGEMTTEQMNEYSLYMDWLSERSGMDMTYFNGFITEDIHALSTKYGSDYLGFSMYWNFLERKKFSAGYFFGSAVTVYLFPLYLKWQFSPYHYTGYTFVMTNTKNGYVSFVDAKNFDVKYRNYLIKAHIYNSLNQLAK